MHHLVFKLIPRDIASYTRISQMNCSEIKNSYYYILIQCCRNVESRPFTHLHIRNIDMPSFFGQSSIFHSRWS